MDFNAILKQFQQPNEKAGSSKKTENDEDKVVPLRNLCRGHKPTYERAISSERTSQLVNIFEEKEDQDIGSNSKPAKRSRDFSDLREAHVYPPGRSRVYRKIG